MKKVVLFLLCMVLLLPLVGCDKYDPLEWEQKLDSIEVGATYDEVIAILGEPDADIGYGVSLLYVLPERHVVVIGMHKDNRMDVPTWLVTEKPVVQTYDEFYEQYRYYPDDPNLLSDYYYRCNDGQGEIVLKLSGGVNPDDIDLVYFDSFDEMIEDIREGRFTLEEKMQIYYFRKDMRKPIPVYDLDNLYMPVLPDGMSYGISWEGDTYYCYTETEQFHICYSFVPEEEWQSSFDVSNWKLLSTEEDTGAKLYLKGKDYRNHYHRRVRDISEGDATFHIVEYYLDYPQTRYSFGVFVEQNGIRYIVHFLNMKEEPSDEFIRQLRVAPYTNE